MADREQRSKDCGFVIFLLIRWLCIDLSSCRVDDFFNRERCGSVPSRPSRSLSDLVPFMLHAGVRDEVYTNAFNRVTSTSVTICDPYIILSKLITYCY